eukprot:3691643-Rhodomonas_salina.4
MSGTDVGCAATRGNGGPCAPGQYNLRRVGQVMWEYDGADAFGTIGYNGARCWRYIATHAILSASILWYQASLIGKIYYAAASSGSSGTIPPFVLRIRYAISGADTQIAPIVLRMRYAVSRTELLSYARATQCPVLTWSMLLTVSIELRQLHISLLAKGSEQQVPAYAPAMQVRAIGSAVASYAMSGTEMSCAGTCAMCGTERVNAIDALADIARLETVCYRPTFLLCYVRYRDRAICGTDVAYQIDILLRACYAMRGTEIAYQMEASAHVEECCRLLEESITVRNQTHFPAVPVHSVPGVRANQIVSAPCLPVLHTAYAHAVQDPVPQHRCDNPICLHTHTHTHENP